MSINRNITLTVTVALLLAIGIITGLSIAFQHRLAEQAEEAQLDNLYFDLLTKIETQQQLAGALATAFAQIPNVQAAFARSDRTMLTELLLPAYLALAEKFGVSQTQFHLPPATSFLRLHQLEKYGDDLSTFRYTVLAANQQKQMVSGLEKGKGGYGIRGVTPIGYQGHHVGTFEVGLEFDQAFLDSFKQDLEADLSIYLREDDSKVDSFAEEDQGMVGTSSAYTLYASTLPDPPPLNAELRTQVYDTGQPVVVRLDHNHIPYAVKVVPIWDYNHDVVGLAEIYLNREAVLGQIATNRNLVLAIGLVIFAVTTLLVRQVLVRQIIRPLQRLTAISGQIAQGQVNVQIEHNDRPDEIGALNRAFEQIIAYFRESVAVAEVIAGGDLSVKITPKSEQDALGLALNRMTDNLQTLVGQVIANAKAVGQTSRQLFAIADEAGVAAGQVDEIIWQVAEGVTQQTTAILHTTTVATQISQAIEGLAQGAQEQATAINLSSALTTQISASIQKVADNARVGVEGSVRAAETARSSAKTIAEAIRHMQLIQDKMEVLARHIEEMGQHSGQIGVIVETIDDIASQTNLLALNAAIEAARAGEHGKGFAVVADEVRKLAEKSALSTKEVTGLIKNISLTVAEAIRAMTQSTAEVEAGVLRTSHAGAALAEILASSEAITQQVEQIAGAAQVMANSAGELVESMSTISAVVEENTAATEQMAASSREVATEIESVASLSQETNAAIQEITATTQGMRHQVEGVRQSTQTMKTIAETLTEAASRFKLDRG